MSFDLKYWIYSEEALIIMLNTPNNSLVYDVEQILLS